MGKMTARKSFVGGVCVCRKTKNSGSLIPLADKQHCDSPVLLHGLTCNRELCFGLLFKDAELLDFANASSAKKSMKMQTL